MVEPKLSSLNQPRNDFTLQNEECFEFVIGGVRIVRKNTNVILPDGTRLNDQINSHLLDTIKKILNFEKERNSSDASLPSIFTSLYLLVQWMFLKGIYRFEHLSDSHTREFSIASAKGLDFLINATPRIIDTLKKINIEDIDKNKIKYHILELTNINPDYIRKLPRVNELIENFLSHGSLDIKNTVNSPLEKMLSQAVLQIRFSAVRLLWTYRDKLDININHDPFPKGVAYASISLGREPGATKTIPVELVPNLVAGAICWVEKFAPYFIKIKKLGVNTIEADDLIKEFNNENINNLGWSLVKRTKDIKSEISIKKAITLTKVACLIIMHIFTARRSSEISGLKSYSLIGEFNNRFILSDIGKTHLKDEPTPCPEIVAIAFNTMLGMRGISNQENVNLWNNGKNGIHNYSKDLDFFARVVGAEIYTSDGVEKAWHYAVHQFRRIFAILFVWRFEGPFSSIQHHLRHISWKQTFHYVRDKKFYNNVISESVALTTNKLHSIAIGDLKKPAGVQSLVFKKHIDRLRKIVDVTDKSSLERHIKIYVEDRGLILRPSEWGYCGAKSNTSNLRRAACQKESNVSRALDPIFNTPDASGSSQEICSSCFFHFSDETREAHWRDELKKIIEIQKLVDSESEAGRSLKNRREKIQAFINHYYE